MPTAPTSGVAMVGLKGGRRNLFRLKTMMFFFFFFDLVLDLLVWSLVCDLGIGFVFWFGIDFGLGFDFTFSNLALVCYSI